MRNLLGSSDSLPCSLFVHPSKLYPVVETPTVADAGGGSFQIVETIAAEVAVAVAFPCDLSTHYHQFEGSCSAHVASCEAFSVTWDSVRKFAPEAVIRLQK